MEQPINVQYKQWKKDNRGGSKAAFSNWRKKYFKGDPENKPEEDVNGPLVPGKLYTFINNTPGTKVKRVVHDRLPIFLSMGMLEVEGRMLEGGINFNVVPPKLRLAILDKIYSLYKSPISSNYEMLADGQKAQKALQLNFEFGKKALAGTGFEAAYYVYDRSNMVNIKVIDYDDWVAIVDLNTQGITEKAINSVFQEYIERMNTKVDRFKELSAAAKEANKGASGLRQR